MFDKFMEALKTKVEERKEENIKGLREAIQLKLSIVGNIRGRVDEDQWFLSLLEGETKS